MAKNIYIYQIPWVLKIDQMNNSGETTRKKDKKKNDNKGMGAVDSQKYIKMKIRRKTHTRVYDMNFLLNFFLTKKKENLTN